MAKGMINILSGIYISEENDCVLDISQNDFGVNIVCYDDCMDIYYKWVIDNGKLVQMTIETTIPYD